MDYQRIYDSIILKAKSRDVIIEYTEKHHIIPRCMGGSNDSDNLVRLTAREHFICHWLLWRIFRTNKMAYAFHMMCTTRLEKRYKNSRAFAEARNALLEVVRSPEHRAKISAAMKGREFTAEHRASLSAAQTGKKRSPESVARGNAKRRGHIRSIETRNKIGDIHRGMTHSIETKNKISATKKGKKQTPEHIANVIAAKMRMNPLWSKVDEIKDLRAQGLSYPKIADRYNSHPGMMKKICGS